MKTTPRYAHTQKGVLQPILLALAAICLGGMFFMREAPPCQIIMFMAATIVCVVLSFAFSYLAIRDEGDHLTVRFGPVPLFKKSIPYAAITAADKDRSHFLSGWGIHPTKKGWLWNIGGFDCVRIEMGPTNILLGTDDPADLVAFLRSKTGTDILSKRQEKNNA